MRTIRTRLDLRGARLGAAMLALAAAPEVAAQDRGKQIFTNAEPPCAMCHVLQAAGAKGRVGPSLDQLKPTEEQVRSAIQAGPGAMPEYENLSEEDISAVASYVARVAGRRS